MKLGVHRLEIGVLGEVGFGVIEQTLGFSLQLDFRGAQSRCLVEEVVLVGGF